VAPPLTDAGPPPDPAQAALAAARSARSRISAAEQQPSPDPAAISAEAKTCAQEAHRSWAEQFPEAAREPDRARAASLVGPAGAEALYLEALCAATLARMEGFTPLIDRRAQLIAAFERVARLAPDLDGAGAERELGALYAALPTHAGGDLELARKHLLAAVERAPEEARNHVVLARAVAVKAQDRALFRDQLRLAKSCPNAAAAEAEALLQRETELFGPGEAAQPIPK